MHSRATRGNPQRTNPSKSLEMMKSLVIYFKYLFCPFCWCAPSVLGFTVFRSPDCSDGRLLKYFNFYFSKHFSEWNNMFLYLTQTGSGVKISTHTVDVDDGQNLFHVKGQVRLCPEPHFSSAHKVFIHKHTQTRVFVYTSLLCCF